MRSSVNKRASYVRVAHTLVNNWSLLRTLESSNRDADGSAITRPDSPVHVSVVGETATSTVTVQTAVPSASEHRLRGGGGGGGGDHRRFKQVVLHPAGCQPTTNSLQSACWALWSLSTASTMPCHISPGPAALKDRASCDSSSQHTALCRSAFSRAAAGAAGASWTSSGDKRLPECLARGAIYTNVRVIHSWWRRTLDLCVHFTSARHF